jgi:hypothetical protein
LWVNDVKRIGLEQVKENNSDYRTLKQAARMSFKMSCFTKNFQEKLEQFDNKKEKFTTT